MLILFSLHFFGIFKNPTQTLFVFVTYINIDFVSGLFVVVAVRVSVGGQVLVSMHSIRYPVWNYDGKVLAMWDSNSQSHE